MRVQNKSGHRLLTTDYWLLTTRRNRRTGFTLVELLIVILIIGLLVSLISAAAMKGISSANRTRNANDLRQLTTAIENFKATYGIYPPSRIKLSETCNYPNRSTPGTLDAISVAYLQRIWPRIVLTPGTFIDWNGNKNMDPPVSPSPTTKPDGDVILEGDQCLVFFLGGIPDNFSQLPGAPDGKLYPDITRPNTTGFSTNAQNPAAHILTAGPVVNPFYEFASGRLLRRAPGVQYTANAQNYPTTFPWPPPAAPGTPPMVFPQGNPTLAFYSYKDTYSIAPYAFFSSNTTRNGYLPLSSVLAISGTPTSDCQTLGIFPYAEAVTPSPKFLNPNTCQIISAGADGVFGPGTTGASTTWTPATAATANPSGSPGYDDQSNFHDTLLGAGS
jgi:general secretion pathway protein G